MPESDTIDLLDMRILQALSIDHRAPFVTLGDVLGVSEQTVARRYRRLREAGVQRVVGLVNPEALGQTIWTVRVQTRPGATLRLAEALAARDDTSWVGIGAGGAEVQCSVRARSLEHRDDLLFARLPNTSQVLSFSAQAALHRFAGHGVDDWLGSDLLSATERDALRPDTVTAQQDRVDVGVEDEPLLALLHRDGRAPYSALARATGLPERRVRQRVDELRAHGLLYFDLDISLAALGFGMQATLFLSVAPGELVATGERFARDPEAAYVAAITGTANLQVSVVLRDAESLYRYVTERVGSVPAVRQIEVNPTLRTVKQAGSIISGQRLAVDTSLSPGRPVRARAAG